MKNTTCGTCHLPHNGGTEHATWCPGSAEDQRKAAS